MDVLNYMNETGASSIEAAAIFNTSSPGMIRRWRRTFEIVGVDGLPSDMLSICFTPTFVAWKGLVFIFNVLYNI